MSKETRELYKEMNNLFNNKTVSPFKGVVMEKCYVVFYSSDNQRFVLDGVFKSLESARRKIPAELLEYEEEHNAHGMWWSYYAKKGPKDWFIFEEDLRE